MQILSLCLSTLGFLALVIASLTKGDKIKRILILVFLANLLYAVGYTVGGSGINGAASCYLGALISLINYFFDAKNKPIPKWLAALYGVAFAVLNVAVTLVSIANRLGLAGAMLSAVFSIGQLIGFGVGAFFALVSFASAVYCRIKHGVKITRVLVAVALTTFIIVSYLLAIQLINHLA